MCYHAIMCYYYIIQQFMWHHYIIIAKPPFTKPPLVNSRGYGWSKRGSSIIHQIQNGLYKSCGVQCVEGIMLEPGLLQPCLHVAGRLASHRDRRHTQQELSIYIYIYIVIIISIISLSLCIYVYIYIYMYIRLPELSAPPQKEKDEEANQTHITN